MALPKGRITDVVIIPVNGYANRLQAWASAGILASSIGAQVSCLWVTEEVAPTPAAILFSSTLLEQAFIEPADAQERWGLIPQDVPRYLSLSNGIVTLAGHDKGEQYFMNDLEQIIRSPEAPPIIAIRAGGHFHVVGSDTADADRAHFYRQIAWAPEIDDAVSRSAREPGSYVGLHIRESDRARTAPTHRQVLSAITEAANTSGLTSVLVAADSKAARTRWCDVLREHGLSPWTSTTEQTNRSHLDSGVSAMVDWRLLGDAHSLVYSQESSFGHEASLLNKHPDLAHPLSAGPTLRWRRDLYRHSNNLGRRLGLSRY